MPLSITPYIPEYITVHTGPASAQAENVTVTFSDYIKNVASSEIYPTWGESALRANILAQISFALNRVYTEYYPSRGYPFQITSSTQNDQKFINGRNIFENVSNIVDQLFTTYIRRRGFVEPLSARFCNGTTVTCDGLSQWGSEALAREGYDFLGILRYYYGDDIELVTNAPIAPVRQSYPGYPLREGSVGEDVVVLQTMLNRVGRSYPAIPAVSPVDGIFGPQTEAAVRRFQEIFGLSADGIVGPATWYALVRLYVGVLSLAELRSQGQQFYNVSWNYSGALQQGSTGEYVRQLQYMLQVLAEFIPAIPPVNVDGIYGPATQSAVLAAQRYFGLPQTGTVDERTWQLLESQFNGVGDTVFRDGELFPEGRAVTASTGPAPQGRYENTTTLTQFPGFDLRLGSRDEPQREA